MTYSGYEPASQTKVPCRICKRKIGSRHSDNCPRSRRMQRLLNNTLEFVGRPKPVWLQGTFTFQKNGPDGRPKGSMQEATNPGLPFVRLGGFKRLNRGRRRAFVGGLWFEGGIPRAVGREGCLSFCKQMGMVG